MSKSRCPKCDGYAPTIGETTSQQCSDCGHKLTRAESCPEGPTCDGCDYRVGCGARESDEEEARKSEPIRYDFESFPVVAGVKESPYQVEPSPSETTTGTYEPFTEGVEVIKPLDAMWESGLSRTIARMIEAGPVRVTWKVEMER